MNKLITEYATIQTKINTLINMHKSIDSSLRMRQMQILQQLDDEFVRSGVENIGVYQVRIRYNSMLKFLAEELGLPVKKYIDNLKTLAKNMGIPEEEGLL